MRHPQSVLRLWFTFEDRVDRRTYFIHGLALMALKYVVDAAFIWMVLGRLWTPVDYLSTNIASSGRLGNAARPVVVGLALWTLPFLWIGVSMSMRRAIDAGRSGWLCVFFFVPYVNYLFMVVMCLLPTDHGTPMPVESPRTYEARLPSALLSIGAGAGIGLLAIAGVALGLESYGITIFFGTPFVVGAVTAFLFNRRYPAGLTETMQVVVMTFVFIAGALMLLAIEGLMCLLMAAPLVIAVSLMGAAIGRWMALGDTGSTGRAMLAILLVPTSAMMEPAQARPNLHEVLSVVEIDAPPAVVWRHVIEFPELAPPTELVFRSGIAYPIRARIEGTGVGAVRHCVFSTGSFIEPITHWEPGHLLAFDVTEQPAPLEEWSPYAGIAPPHLDGYFRTTRGEFRLVQLPNGQTRLEGRTWYELRIHPEAYWMLFSDVIIGRIHDRVLMHIERLAETEYDSAPRDAR